MRAARLVRSLVAAAAVLALPLVATPPAGASSDGGVAAARLTVSEVDLETAGISPVTVTLDNHGSVSLQQVEVALAGPIGWTISPASQSVKGAVRPGESVDVTFQIRVPEPPERMVFRTFTATADYKAHGGEHTVTATRTQSTGFAYADLAEAYNNVGVSDEADPGKGDFDGDGNSYSAQALAAAGVTPGATVHALGATFTWPDVPAGTRNNVSAQGQTVRFSGQGERLAFLGAAAGAGTGAVTVAYTDGTTSTGTLGFPNWCCTTPTSFGATPVIEMDHRNTPTGPANFGITYRVFANSIEIDPARTVASVTLPSSSSLHVFDLALVTGS